MSRRHFFLAASSTLALPAAFHFFAAPMREENDVQDEFDFEVAIVGGGPAGLSAALTLGRSRRATVVFDAGAPRNAPAHAAHNFFTRDGTPPLELIRIGREQLAPYDGVQLRNTKIVAARPLPAGGFELEDSTAGPTTCGTLVLATGVVDELPPIPGLRELWGTGVFHCPYCHGWEVRDEPFVLIAQHEGAMHLAALLQGWTSRLTVCPTSPEVLSAEQRQTLEASYVRVKAPVARLEGGPEGRVSDVILEGGERLGAAAVFTSATLRQRSPLPEQLGCTLHDDGPISGLVKVDERGFSGVPGLYVAGDASQGFPQVVNAACEGSNIGAVINNELLLAGQLPRGSQLASG